MKTTSDSEAELEPNDVIFMKPVALERVYHQCCLFDRIEIGEAEMDLVTVFGLSGNEAQLFEARVRTEDVSHFALSGIVGEALNVDSLCGIFRVLH